jgi:uncharacterized OB-fold protein
VTERRPNRVRGPGHDDFWTYCAAGELRLQRCDACQHLSWPPTETCERCDHSRLRWEQLSGRGRIVSWCSFERRYYEELEIPWDTIVVELDEGPLFISNPSGFRNEEVTQGMPVQVTFLGCEDDAGSFQLPVFERR